MSPTNSDNDEWDDTITELEEAAAALLAEIKADDSDLSPFVTRLAEALDKVQEVRGKQ